jgi:hypothetical protein
MEPDDLQMICSTKRTGGLSPHGRRDLMSIMVYGYGSPLVIHPPRGLDQGQVLKGNKLVVDPPAPCKNWGEYLGGIWSHSVAAVGSNGGLYNGRGGWRDKFSDSALGVEAVVADSGTGYFKGGDGKGHFRRAMLLLKNNKDSGLPGKGYFVLVDDVLDAKPDADTRWLLQTRGAKVEGEGDTRTWTSYDFLSIPPAPVRLTVHWVRPEGSEMTIKTGIFAPTADVHLHPRSRPKGEPRPFPEIAWKGPGRMITVLYPLAEGMEAPRIEDLPPSTGSRQAGKRGVKVGGDTIAADAQQVVITRGGRSFTVELGGKQ